MTGLIALNLFIGTIAGCVLMHLLRAVISWWHRHYCVRLLCYSPYHRRSPR